MVFIMHVGHKGPLYITLAEKGTMMSKSAIDAIGDRSGLEEETGAVRLLALIDFSLLLLVLFLVDFFLGFTTPDTKWFLVDIVHIPLVLAAAYAAFRLGFVATIAIIIAFVAFILDFIQLLVRAFGFPLTLLEFVFILVTLAFVVLDILFIATLWRLTSVANNTEIDTTSEEGRERIVAQAGNTVRLTALFGFVGVVFVIVPVGVFLGFSSTETHLCLWSLGQLIVAPYAAFFAPRGLWWMCVLLVFGFILFICDAFVQLIMRITDFTSSDLTTLSLTGIFIVVLILVNIALVFVDVMYILASFDYIYTIGFRESTPSATPAKPATDLENEAAIEVKSELSAYGVRRRRTPKKAE